MFFPLILSFVLGKSSLVSALLGEMLQVRSDSNLSEFASNEGGDGGDDQVLINGRIAYVSQEAWIRNDTVKGNITFGLPYDDAEYKRCIEAACLTHDLAILPNGDLTEIGERGINLSGGQVRKKRNKRNGDEDNYNSLLRFSSQCVRPASSHSFHSFFLSFSSFYLFPSL